MPILTAIEETLDTLDTKISWQDIAKAAGITKSALSHFKKDRSELKFPTLLKIAKYIFKNNYFVQFKEWCLHLNHPKNIKYALEYLAINRQTEELALLIEKIYNEHSSKELLDWADGYSIILAYYRGVDVSEVLHNLRLYSPKYNETKILSSIIEVYCKNKCREYSTMQYLIKGLETSIEEISDDYVRESFGLRMDEILAYISLNRLNKPEEARKHANKIISADFCATLSANAYYIVGMSHLFDNYDECLGNIQKYKDSLISLGRQADIEIVENNDLPFVNNVWNKHTERPATSDISEIAHYEAMQGNAALAADLIEESIQKDGESGFRLYYRALATNDKALFMQALIYFVSKKGDKFFANLPYQHLKDDAMFKTMADMLMND